VSPRSAGARPRARLHPRRFRNKRRCRPGTPPRDRPRGCPPCNRCRHPNPVRRPRSGTWLRHPRCPPHGSRSSWRLAPRQIPPRRTPPTPPRFLRISDFRRGSIPDNPSGPACPPGREKPKSVGPRAPPCRAWEFRQRRSRTAASPCSSSRSRQSQIFPNETRRPSRRSHPERLCRVPSAACRTRRHSSSDACRDRVTTTRPRSGSPRAAARE